MRKWIALGVGLLLLAIANYAIYGKERLLAEGRVALLELAPVDPRSLMQGDYMALRFKVADNIFARQGDKLEDGHAIVELDARGVGHFSRMDDGAPLGANELRMRYRVRDGKVKFATNAFFFQEGEAKIYESALYGEFRVDANGDSLLTGMRGKDLALLGPGRR
jgi:uncharacterized membrane-anchored protein